MICPVCGSATIVLTTRYPDGPQTPKRRRECLGKPAHRFNTWEVTDVSQVTKALYAQRLANRGFTNEAIENILDV